MRPFTIMNWKMQSALSISLWYNWRLHGNFQVFLFYFLKITIKWIVFPTFWYFWWPKHLQLCCFFVYHILVNTMSATWICVKKFSWNNFNSKLHVLMVIFEQFLKNIFIIFELKIKCFRKTLKRFSKITVIERQYYKLWR